MTITQIIREQLRHETDPLADEAIAQIITIENAAHATLRPYIIRFGHEQELTPESRQILQKFKDESVKLPDWANAKKMALGAEVFGDYGEMIVLSLFCAALPLCYSCANGAEVLYSTKRLTSEALDYRIYNERIMKTAQFIMNVMAPGGFIGNNNALQTVQEIRLIHGSIRYYLVNRAESWDTAKYGAPINQEDLTGTLMSFSYVSIDALAKMGMELSADQAEAFQHLWSVVGYVLGVKPELIPQSVDDARLITKVILTDQGAESEAGTTLAAALVGYMDEVLLHNHLTTVTLIMIRYLIGDTKADLLGIPKKRSGLLSFMLWQLKKLLSWFSRFIAHRWFLRIIFASMSRHFLQKMIVHYNNNNAVEFDVPAQLRDSL